METSLMVYDYPTPNEITETEERINQLLIYLEKIKYIDENDFQDRNLKEIEKEFDIEITEYENVEYLREEIKNEIERLRDYE